MIIGWAAAFGGREEGTRESGMLPAAVRGVQAGHSGPPLPSGMTRMRAASAIARSVQATAPRPAQ